MSKPVVLVIFGLTGDLAQRKLLPALMALFADGRFDPASKIVGVSRRAVSVDDVLAKLDPSADGYQQLRQAVSMQQADLDNDDDYRKLDTALPELPKLYYLSVPPESYGQIINHLSTDGQLLIEKPFGYDVASAEALENTIASRFSEDQVYRVDHYLAKAQLINFEHELAHASLQAVKTITIDAYEQLTIEGRAAFYDKVGALRDLVESHLLQVLSVIMTMQATDQHQARQQFLESLSVSNNVRGQYDGYLQDVSKAASSTETYAALELASSLPQWQGTSFTLRSGKALASKQTTITINFEDGHQLTADLNAQAAGHLPDAYETVFLEAADGKHNLFSTSAEILAAWRVVQPVLDEWAGNSHDLQAYPQGADTV